MLSLFLVLWRFQAITAIARRFARDERVQSWRKGMAPQGAVLPWELYRLNFWSFEPGNGIFTSAVCGCQRAERPSLFQVNAALALLRWRRAK